MPKPFADTPPEPGEGKYGVIWRAEEGEPLYPYRSTPPYQLIPTRKELDAIMAEHGFVEKTDYESETTLD